jgi:hypothetical protein
MKTLDLRQDGHIRTASFTVRELIILSAWAEFHDLRLIIEPGHCESGEIVTGCEGDGFNATPAIFRAPDQIVVQPRLGQSRVFQTICDALDAIQTADGTLTDGDLESQRFRVAPCSERMLVSRDNWVPRAGQ